MKLRKPLIRFQAYSVTNRGGCVKKKTLDRCGHEHPTFTGAQVCAKARQAEEKKPRFWCVQKIMFVPNGLFRFVVRG